MTHELDGTYFVSSTSNYDGLAERKSDGATEIRDGKTERRDSNNVLWSSSFEVRSETEVEMTSVADADDAPLDFYLTKPDGTPTRSPVTYKSVLKLARKDERIQMSGQIEYGNEIVFLTLRKTGA